MVIQFASDLHLEFPANRRFLKENPLRPVADILILAGDIMPINQIDEHAEFLDELSANWKKVIWIPGNHEFYGSDISEYQESFEINVRDNIILTSRTVQSLDHLNIICATFWSHVPAHLNELIKTSLSDFSKIKFEDSFFDIPEYNEMHKEDLSFINSALLEFPREGSINVVATHHVPTFINYPESYGDQPLNYAFASEQTEIIKKYNPAYWIYGHHHRNIDSFKIDKTFLITNQLGNVSFEEQHKFLTSETFYVNRNS